MTKELERHLGRATMEGLSRPLTSATGMPSAAYADESFARLEAERLFAPTWVCIGFDGDIPNPGDCLPVELAGTPILLVRGRDGAVRAFHNVCRHRGNLVLTEQKCGLRRLTCPYHMWSYELDGRLVGTPHFGGTDVDWVDGGHRREDLGLKPVRLHHWERWLFVNLSGDAPDFEAFAAPMIADLEGYNFADAVVGTTLTFDFEANWKVVVENFLEALHVFWLHKALEARYADLYAFKEEADAARTRFAEGPYFGAALDLPERYPNKAWGVPEMAGLSEKWRNRHEYLYLFPNLILFLLPGHIISVIDWPVGAGATHQDWRVCFASEAMTEEHRAAREEITAFWKQVNEEDIDVCRTVQKGRSSPAFDGGIFSPYWEERMIDFQRMCMETMA